MNGHASNPPIHAHTNTDNISRLDFNYRGIPADNRWKICRKQATTASYFIETFQEQETTLINKHLCKDRSRCRTCRQSHTHSFLHSKTSSRR
uniref:Uncharacterized protein n=1 Tax=Salix viminalis TaxID=40686 RepID=A0A6N2KTJ3_SALVM